MLTIKSRDLANATKCISHLLTHFTALRLECEIIVIHKLAQAEMSQYSTSGSHNFILNFCCKSACISCFRTLAEACSDGDIEAVKRLLSEGRSVHETTEEGESLLSLACSAGYYELAEVLLRMRANVEDRGIKGDCTPLMEAASGGFVDIARLLIAYDADVNAQSSAGM